MVKARKYVLSRHFQGEPKRSDLKVVEEELPALEDAEFLCKAEYLSVDPYMRLYMHSYPLGTQMIGTQVARVVESKNLSYPVGTLVVGNYGWRDYTLDGGKHEKKDFSIVPTHPLPNIGNLSPSLALGVLGMPGNTAYFGFLEICQPKAGEVVVVTGAAGAVGSIVGQIAKIKGCTVIGFAGSESKCKWLKSELGFDYAFNYKTVDAAKALKEAAPQGIDCFFDNVGGELSATIMSQMNRFGRVSICGVISTYNDSSSEKAQGTMIQLLILRKELKVEGFIVGRWADNWMQGIEQLAQWVQEGKIKYEETITKGFDNIFDGFVGMLRGDNKGKAIIKA